MNLPIQPTDFSLLLWVLAAVVAVLAAHVAQGWVLVSQRAETVRGRWPAWVVAGITLGTGLSGAVWLGVAAQGLMFEVGYRALPAIGLWLGAIVACILAAAAAGSTRRAWLLLGLGVLLALVAAALHVGWLWAAGFRPGIVWRRNAVAAGVILMTVGLPIAMWLSFSKVLDDSGRRALWRLGAAGLLGLSLIGGQELMVNAAALDRQQGSIYEHQLPGTVLSLAAGVLLPLLLLVMTIDLVLRRPSRRRSRYHHHGFNPPKRRKRRHRVRTL